MTKRLILIVLMITLLPAAGVAETRDAGGFKFVEHGSDLYILMPQSGESASPIEIVIMGDGFKLGEQSIFDQAATDFVDELFDFPPYSTWACAFTIWKINLVSNDSGIDYYSGSSLVDRDTPLGCSFGSSSEPVATVRGDFDLCRQAVDASEVPADGYICVIVNDPSTHDGAMSYPTEGVTFMSSAYPWGVVMAHELGHLIAGLGDEYPCSICDPGVWATTVCAPEAWPSDPNNTDLNRTYTGTPAIVAPNLSISYDRASIPWSEKIADDTALPTLSPGEEDLVGAWEGGGTYRYGVYRPQECCVMDLVMFHDEDKDHLCQVCSDALEDVFLWHCVLPVTIVDLGVLVNRIQDPSFRPIRFPFPPCSLCPDSTLLDTDMTIRMFIARWGPSLPHLSRLEVCDDWGQRVAHSTDTPGDSLVVSFQANRARSYYGTLFIDAPGGARDLLIQSELYVNGTRVERHGR